MTQTQSPETTQKAAEKTTRDVVISGLAGLPGGLFGIPLSIGSYLLWRKVGVNGAGRWWAWAVTGLVGVPFSWVLAAAVVAPSAQQSSSSSMQQSGNSAPQAKKQEDVKVGEFQTDNFQYTNVRIAPYTIKDSFAADHTNVAGVLYEITADVTNLSKESKAPHLSKIEASDAQGRTFKGADGMANFGDIQKGHNSTDYVLPGQTKQDIRLAIIDASPDAKDFTLSVSGNLFGRSSPVKPIQ
jgi:hypothetical protein